VRLSLREQLGITGLLGLGNRSSLCISLGLGFRLRLGLGT
jgi:hypothetical protein